MIDPTPAYYRRVPWRFAASWRTTYNNVMRRGQIEIMEMTYRLWRYWERVARQRG